MGHVTLRLPLRGRLPALGLQWIRPTCVQSLTILASTVPEIWLGPQNFTDGL